MREKVFIEIILLGIAFFSSCSIGRYLDSPAYVIIDGPYTLVVPEGDFKYLSNYDVEKYETVYLSGLESALERHNIYSIHLEEPTSDKIFLITISKLNYWEDFTVEMVNSDTLSDSQTVYNVVNCSVDSEFDVYFAGYNGNELLKSTSAISSKEEKLSNRRTFWQMMFRANKDNTIYTYTELQEDVFLDLTTKNANRTAAKTSKVLYKQLK